METQRRYTWSGKRTVTAALIPASQTIVLSVQKVFLTLAILYRLKGKRERERERERESEKER